MKLKTDGVLDSLKSLQDKEKICVFDLTDEFACHVHVAPIDEASPDLSVARLHQSIFGHGAKPMASLLSASIKSANHTLNKQSEALLDNVAKSVNRYGVPMVGGDVCFGNADNYLALSVGLSDKMQPLSCACSGEGNLVFLINRYGDDNDISTARSTCDFVEALHKRKLLAAINTVDSAGVIGACAEMVAAGTNGMCFMTESLIDTLEQWPQLFEYQTDSIVVIVAVDDLSDMEILCRQWGKQWLQIGVVIDEPSLLVCHGGAIIAEIPVETLCERHEEPVAPALRQSKAIKKTAATVFPEEDMRKIVQTLINSSTFASKQWFFERFDGTVGGVNLSTNFVSDAAVVQLKGTRHALAIAFETASLDTTHENETGALLTAGVIRKTVCSGGTPLAVIACLTLSAGAKPETVVQTKLRIAELSAALGIETIDVRVFTTDKDIAPQLSVACVAFIDDKHKQMTSSLKSKGDMLYLLGKTDNELYASEYLRLCYPNAHASLPPFDMAAEAKLQATLRQVIGRKLIKSAHNVACGGLFMSLVESALIRGFGFDVTSDSELTPDAFLFNETPSRVMVSVATTRESDFIDFMMNSGVPCMTLGHVTREELRIDDNSFGFIPDFKRILKFS